MMMTIYNRLASTSERLIASFGKNVKLITKRNTWTAYDPTQSETSVTVKAVVNNANANASNADLIQQGDKEFLIYYTGTITPDMIIRDGVDYQIIAVNTIQPASNIILYSVIGRK
jgi:hypothetical protein